MSHEAIRERVLSKIDKTDTCWTWLGARDHDGYGRIRVEGRYWRAPRLVYELLIGPIPPGLFLDHLCRNPTCVRPEHLEPVTNAENIRRGLIGQRTHCKRGHPYTPENTYMRHPWGRRCRLCANAYADKYRKKKIHG